MGEATVNATNVTINGSVNAPAYRNAQSEGMPNAGAMVNTIMSMVMPMIFSQVKDARSWSAYGGGGSFRPSETWARAQDQNARASAMGVASPDRVAAEVSRRTQEHAQELMRSGVGLSPTQQREYANSIEPQARAAVRAQLAASKQQDIENLTRAYQNVALKSYSKEELTDDKRKAIATEAREQATKTREALSNPLTAGIAVATVRAAEERGGAGLSNLAPELFLGGGVFDALRKRTGSGGVAPGVASDITKMISDAMFNKDGTINYGFTHGQSALGMADLMVSGASRGMIDTSVATGRAGSIGTAQYEAKSQALKRDMHQMAEIGESLKDLFGSGGSVDEMLTRFDHMTGGAMRTMSKDRIKRLIADTAFVADSTGQSADQIEAMITSGVQYAARAGLSGEVGAKLSLDSVFQAGSITRSRDGNTYMGMEDTGELASTIMQEMVAGMTSSDSIAMGAAAATARTIAYGTGAKGVKDMTQEQVFELVAKQAEARGDLQSAAQVRGLNDKIANGEFGDLDSTEAISVLSRAAGYDVSQVYDTKRLTRDNSVQAEQSGQTVAMKRRQLKDKDDLIANSAAEVLTAGFRGPNKDLAAATLQNKNKAMKALRAVRKHSAVTAEDQVAAISKELGISTEEASSMKSVLDSVLSASGPIPGEHGGLEAHAERYGEKQLEQQRIDITRRSADEAMDKTLRAQGVGSGSIVQKLVNDIIADPEASMGASLGKLVTGEVSSKDYEHLAPILGVHAARKREIADKNKSGEYSDAEADRQYRAANADFAKAIGGDAEAQKELRALEERKSSGDAGLDTQKEIEKNTADIARNTDPDREAKEQAAKEADAQTATESGGDFAEGEKLWKNKHLEGAAGMAAGTKEGQAWWKQTTMGSRGEIIGEHEGYSGGSGEGSIFRS